MIAEQFIDSSIPYLKTSDKVRFALNLMEEYSLNYLPLVKNGKLLGMVNEEQISEIPDHEISLQKIMPGLENISCTDSEHFFKLLQKMDESHLTIMPIVDQAGGYLGLATTHKIVEILGQNMSIMEPGGILMLEMDQKDYSLTEISRIVESNSASILHAYITPEANSPKIFVTLKVNVEDLSGIIQSFERFNFKVKATFHRSAHEEGLKDRVDSLLMYLNV